MIVSTPHDASSATRIASFTVHASDPVARRVRACDVSALEQRVLRVERDAAERDASARASRRAALDEPGARQRRARPRAPPRARLPENDDSSGGTSAPRHNVAASSAIAAPVSRSRPGVGLISMLQRHAVGAAQRAIASSVGHRLARVVRASASSRRRGATSSRHGSASARPRPSVVRSSVCVVQQERYTVGGELHVELDHPVAVRAPSAHRGERVLRARACRRRDARPARVRPGGNVDRHVSESARRSRRRTGNTRAASAASASSRRSPAASRAAARDDRACPRRGRRERACRRPAARPFRLVPARRASPARTTRRCSGRMPTITSRPVSTWCRGVAHAAAGSSAMRAGACALAGAGSSSPASR